MMSKKRQKEKKRICYKRIRKMRSVVRNIDSVFICTKSILKLTSPLFVSEADIRNLNEGSREIAATFFDEMDFFDEWGVKRTRRKNGSFCTIVLF